MKTIELSNGKFAKVDNDLYPFLIRYKWNCSSGYALTRFIIKKNQSYSVTMHRLIMRMSNKNIDHINGDKLDNRVINLRYCEHGQNMINFKRPNTSSGYRGVYKNSGTSYSARITAKGKRRNIGTYKSAKAAAMAYDLAARRLHKKFAVYNFPKKVLGES